MAPSSLTRFFFLSSFLSLGFASQFTARESTEGVFRQLKAATKRSDLLKRRSDNVELASSVELAYAEHDNSDNGRPSFVSTIKGFADIPVLVLEDIEHHLKDVQCSDSLMNLSFNNSIAHDAIKRAYDTHEKGIYVVTSHDGCNSDDERKIYHVESILNTGDQKTLSMTTSPSHFEDAFGKMHVSFGHTTEGHTFRSELRRLRSRQEYNSTTTTLSTAANVTPSTTTHLSIPSATDTSISIDLSSSISNTTLAVESLPVDFECTNCSTFGTLDVTQGSFEVDLAPTFIDGDGISFSDGYIKVDASGLGARVEITASPSGSGTISLPIPAIAIPAVGFTIPGVGTAGLTFTPDIEFSWDIDGTIELTFGVEAIIPDNSTINIAFSDLKDSSASGFENVEIEALPFQANVSDASVSIAVAFVPTITFGFQFFQGQIEATIDIFSHLPTLNSTFALLDDVDANCEPLSNTTASNPEISDEEMAKLLASLGDLTKITSSVDLDVGIGAELNILNIIPVTDLPSSLTLFSTSYPIGTACLAFEPTGLSFVPASEALASATNSYLSSLSAAATTSASPT